MIGNRTIKTCIVSSLVAVILFRFVFAVIYIPTSSMEPAIKAGSFGIAWRLPYIINSRKTVNRGDIVIFRREGDPRLLCKRVIGLEGETVIIHSGKVYIDGRLLEESYVVGTTEGEMSVTVPEGCLFMMGDNREHSFDSRYWPKITINERSIYARFMTYILR